MIRFDDAARAVTLSVRDIADSSDYRFSGPMAVGLRKRAEMGREAHESHQGAREEALASYRRERSLRFETEVEGWRVVVVGRIDGVFTDPQGRTVIEEVKTVLAAASALERMDERTYPHYSRQLQLYRFLLEEGARALGFDDHRGSAPEIALHLCFIALPGKERRTVEVGYDRESCKELVRARLVELVREHEKDAASRAERQARRGKVHFPFPETRAHQDSMIGAVMAALQERRPILVSAPPGTGKTAGALVPALRYAYEIGGRVFVATSKTTQQKMFADTLRMLREAGTPVRSVVLVAKEKACLNDVVVCHPEVCHHARDYPLKLERSGALERLRQVPVADLEAVRAEGQAHVFCPFEAALDLTGSVDVIIGDYNYVFDPSAALKRMFVEETPDDIVLVIDEAHNLYDRGAEYYSPELPRPRVKELERALAGAEDALRRRIRGILRDLDAHLALIETGLQPKKAAPPKPPKEAPRSNLLLFHDPDQEAKEKDKAARLSERMNREKSGRRRVLDDTSGGPGAPRSPAESISEVEPESGVKEPLPALPPEREVQLDKAFFLALRDELDELMVAYQTEFAGRRSAEPGAPRRAYLGAAEDPLVDFHRLYSRFASVLELEGDEWSYIYRRSEKNGPGGGTLKVLCKDPSRQLGRRIRACAGAVAVSATLEPLEFYRDVLGFPRDETELRAFPSPFPREHRRVLVLDRPSTHYKDRDRDLPIVEDAVRAVIAARPGNYLVAFPSFEYLEMLTARIGEVPGFEIVKQKKSMSDGERTAVLARLGQFQGPGKAGPPPVLLLAVQGGVFTEGVDLPGEMCIGAIVVGPGLPRLSFERELVKAHFDRVYGRGFEYAYLFPGMSRVIQAAGRVIRTATDVGVVALVGDRFAQERYTSLFPRDWFAKHPRELVTTDPYGELRRFWASHQHDLRGAPPPAAPPRH